MNINTLISIDEVDTSLPLESFADKLSYGGTLVLIGMLTIFSVLVIIMIALYGFKYFFHDLAKAKSNAPKPEKVDVAPVVIPVSNPDEEVVAAITAAIAMAESESNGIKFRVVSFKRR